jgi:Protein of unknown function (DUF2637)
MSDFPGTRQLRETDYNSRLQMTAVVIVITGVLLLAVSTFLLSYAQIHEIAVAAGISPALARLYPLILDITLVVACATALALRGAAWWMRAYAALAIIILVTVVAVVEAVHAAGISLPQRAVAATLAAVPWALLLLGFGLALSMLRHQRTVRALARPGDPGDGEKSVGGAGLREPEVNQQSAGSVPGNADPDAPDAGLVPAEPKPASPGPDPSPPELSLTPGPGHEHRHGPEHHHHGHGNGDDGRD